VAGVYRFTTAFGGGNTMLVIYLSMLNDQEDKNKFELLYEKYRKLMFYIANEIWFLGFKSCW